MVVDVILTLIFGDARVKLALLIPLIFKPSLGMECLFPQPHPNP
jgi:hypothetical protein